MAAVMRLLDLAGKSAIVTGTSAGIGAAVARELCAQGTTVLGLDVVEPACPMPSNFQHLHCDIRVPAAIQEAASRLPAGKLDYMVNVAGKDPKISLQDGDAAAWDELVNLNLRSQYLLIRACAPLLEVGAGKAIVNISSINYRLGVPKRAIYTASKAGVLGLTRGLARELGAKGIRINTVTPGWIWTEAQLQQYFDHPDPAESQKYRSYLAEVQSLPEKQILPSDIANHVLFLLSSASSGMTGSNVVVDAGWTLE